MSFADGSHAYQSPGGQVVYGDEAFDTATRPAIAPELDRGVVDRFHALIDEVTDALMAGQSFDRAACRADAITMLLAATELPDAPESPLKYLLQKERAKALGALGVFADGTPGDAVTEPMFLKA